MKIKDCSSLSLFPVVVVIIIFAYSTTVTALSPPRKVVIIGGGWAGFSAADALSIIQQQQQGQPPVTGSSSTNFDSSTATKAAAFEIELLDASPRGPGGLAGGWMSPKLQRPVEAGLHGFWREYRNTFATMERIGLVLDDVLTPFTPSTLVSQSGRVALAPVLGSETMTSNEGGPSSDSSESSMNPVGLLKGFSPLASFMDYLSTATLAKKLSELLPPPLDLALLSEIDGNNPLTLIDRLSGIGLLGAWADFEQEDAASWDRYDKISAENLFRSVAGVTPTLYNELVAPLLHVLPMTPGYDCSAAAALSCFHVFALQTRGAFDVRWCRGTLTDKIFNPWTKLLQQRGNVKVRGAAKVTSIEEVSTNSTDDKSTRPSYRIMLNEGTDTIVCDDIIFAVGGTALKRLVPTCPPLSKLPESEGWKQFRGVTCVAVRLFFDPRRMIPSFADAMKDSPVAVCGPNIGKIPELTETGFCIYDIEKLQDSDEIVGAVEVDFFRADALASRSDEVVVSLTLKAIAAALAIPGIDRNLIVDYSVVRARDAVSHFCVNSAARSPPVKLNGPGLYICGDWIDRKGHASWSTEKSVVTGIQAATALANDVGVPCPIKVIPSASDTPQLTALRQLARSVRRVAPPGLDVKPQAPWVAGRGFFSR
jgi:uncharacterized protein with NAD-binding domain and iron-sulfur cluster